MNEWFGIALAGILSGMAGSMGLGGGTVLLLYLTLFAGVDQLTAQGINLIFFLPIAVLALVLHGRNGLIAWKDAIAIALLGLAGAAAGTILSGWIDGDVLQKDFRRRASLHRFSGTLSEGQTKKAGKPDGRAIASFPKRVGPCTVMVQRPALFHWQISDPLKCSLDRFSGFSMPKTNWIPTQSQISTKRFPPVAWKKAGLQFLLRWKHEIA